MGEGTYTSTNFLTLELDGGISTSWPGRFILEEKATYTQRIGDWVGASDGLDALVTAESFCCCWQTKNLSSVVQSK
jgi:hypothetical protein